MEIRTLQALVEVVRHGGFSPAARAVHSTQSTVSKAVKQLEDELGVPLLVRAGRRSFLTPAGEVVHRRALAMLAEREDLRTELDELRGVVRGVLRIGLPPIGSDVLFAPWFAEYRRRHPGIQIQLVEHGSDRLAEMVNRGELDLAGVLPPVPSGCESRHVRTEPIDVLLSAGHPLAAQAQVSFRQLAEQPFVLFDTGFALNRVIIAGCQRAGFTPRVAASSSQVGFIAELVAAGVGVAFFPRMIATQLAHARLIRRPLARPAIEWRMNLIWRRGGYLSHAASAWLALAGTTPVRLDSRSAGVRSVS